MPTYHYRCKNCGYDFTEQQRSMTTRLPCAPKCSQEQVRKVYSAVPIEFKGHGFYRTDKIRQVRSVHPLFLCKRRCRRRYAADIGTTGTVCCTGLKALWYNLASLEPHRSIWLALTKKLQVTYGCMVTFSLLSRPARGSLRRRTHGGCLAPTHCCVVRGTRSAVWA